MGNKQENKRIGSLGEQIAARYLTNKGFTVIKMNYLKPWGEIDIIARGQSTVTRETRMSPNQLKHMVTHETIVHFVEVKTLSYESRAALEAAVSHETWRPEERVHQFKLHQIHKALETWVAEQRYTGNWQIDVVAVRLVEVDQYAKVELIENIT